MSVTDILKKVFCCCTVSPRQGLTYSWLVCLGLVLVSFIVACISAAKMEKTGAVGAAASFSCVWTALLLIFISVVGTVILRRYQDSMSIGVLLGIIFIMFNQMMILFAIFVERSQNANQPLATIQSQQAMAVFSFFLMTVYGFFGLLLFTFRHDVIDKRGSGEEVPVHDQEEA